MEKNKRYTAQIEFHVYAKNDKEAEKKVLKICEKQSRKKGNNFMLTNLIDQPFGSFYSRKVDIFE